MQTGLQDDKTKALIALLLGGLCLGVGPIMMRYSDIAPPAEGFWRVALSVPLLLGWFFLQNRNKGTAKLAMLYRDSLALKLAMLAGLFFAIDLACWHYAIEFTSVTNATLIPNLAPLVTAAGCFFIFGERYSRKFVAGMAITLVGAFVLMGHSFEVKPENLKGDLLGVATALAYGSYYLVISRARRHYPTSIINLGATFFTAIFLLPILVFTPGALIPDTAAGWVPLLGLAVVSQVLGQSFILFGLAHLSAAFGTITLLLQPLIAAVLAAILFQEILTVYHLIGAILIVGGITISKKGSN